MSLDRNANDRLRVRRNWQRSRTGAMTADIDVVAPIKIGSTGIFLNLDSAGGLQSVSQALGIKLADTSLQLSASGASVKLKATPGLTVSSGLGVLLDSTNPGLTLASGLKVLLNGSSLLLGASGLSINTGGVGLTQLGALTTKGDVLTHTGAAHVRQGVGANNTILVADSAQTNGLKWATMSTLMVFNEAPAGTIDGVNTAFTLANTAVAGTVQLFKTGLLLRPTTDYTHSGSNITMIVAPAGGSWLLAHYLK